jgi:predicted RNase H-like nuclease (RuvC/YqgF family)
MAVQEVPRETRPTLEDEHEHCPCVERLTVAAHRFEEEARQATFEVERLQRENGALARVYALAEEALRGRTARMHDAESQVTTLEWQLSEANKEIERLHAPPHGPTAYSDTGQYDDGGKWADLQSDTEAIDGDQVL